MGRTLWKTRCALVANELAIVAKTAFQKLFAGRLEFAAAKHQDDDAVTTSFPQARTGLQLRTIKRVRMDRPVCATRICRLLLSPPDS